MENLIHRARLALGAGLTAPEVAETLMKAGASAEVAFLAIQAGEILLRDEPETDTSSKGRRERMITLPGIPVLKKKEDGL